MMVISGSLCLAAACAEDGEDSAETGANETDGTGGDMSDTSGMGATDTSGAMEDSSGSADADTTGGDGGNNDETWGALFAEVIAPSCDNGYCHGGGTGGLLITDAASTYAALVEVGAMGMACGPTGAVRVVPGNPDASLIVQKLEGTQTCGAAMPKDLPSLSQTEIDRIRAWILDGAMNN